MDIWARIRSVEKSFDDPETQTILPHLVVWSLFVAAAAIVLSVVAGDSLGAAVPVGLVAGVVSFVVLGAVLYAWRSVNSDAEE